MILFLSLSLSPAITAQWLSDLTIGLSYVAISTGLAGALKARTMHLPKVFLGLFSAFIILCGLGHLIDAWFGYHGLCSQGQTWKTLVLGSTAVASFGTAVYTLPRLSMYVAITELPAHILELERKVRVLEDAKRDSDDGGSSGNSDSPNSSSSSSAAATGH